MTTREIIAVFLFYIGGQSVASSFLYMNVVGGESALEVVFLTLGIVLILAGWKD
jgi:hypothetical protein